MLLTYYIDVVSYDSRASSASAGVHGRSHIPLVASSVIPAATQGTHIEYTAIMTTGKCNHFNIRIPTYYSVAHTIYIVNCMHFV